MRSRLIRDAERGVAVSIEVEQLVVVEKLAETKRYYYIHLMWEGGWLESVPLPEAEVRVIAGELPGELDRGWIEIETHEADTFVNGGMVFLEILGDLEEIARDPARDGQHEGSVPARGRSGGRVTPRMKH